MDCQGVWLLAFVTSQRISQSPILSAALVSIPWLWRKHRLKAVYNVKPEDYPSHLPESRENPGQVTGGIFLEIMPKYSRTQPLKPSRWEGPRLPILVAVTDQEDELKVSYCHTVI